MGAWVILVPRVSQVRTLPRLWNSAPSPASRASIPSPNAPHSRKRSARHYPTARIEKLAAD